MKKRDRSIPKPKIKIIIPGHVPGEIHTDIKIGLKDKRDYGPIFQRYIDNFLTYDPNTWKNCCHGQVKLHIHYRCKRLTDLPSDIIKVITECLYLNNRILTRSSIRWVDLIKEVNYFKRPQSIITIETIKNQ